MAWYYISNGKECGPVSVGALLFHISADNVKPSDMVRGPGVEFWTPASEVMHLINSSADSPASVSSPAAGSAREGDTASFIGNAVIWLSLIGAVICIISFGRIEVPDSAYSTRTQWSSLLVSIYAAAGLNGAFFGYLLAKVGSILKRLDSRSTAA